MRNEKLRKLFAIGMITVMSASLAGCGASSTSSTSESSAVTSSDTGSSSESASSSESDSSASSSSSASDSDIEAVVAEGTADISSFTTLKESDTVTESDDVTAEITLNGSSIEGSGSGYTISGSTVTISEEGTYVISGTLDDGQIIVSADSTAKVHLILNGVTINCSNSAAIYITQADKTTITLAEGTTNTLTDGSTYTYADTENEEPNACLFSKDDLTINGEGTLTVNGNFNNGIGCKDDLKIVSGTITVDAVNNGIKGNDSITVTGGTITVTSDGDGIKSDNTEDSDKGYIHITGGDITIISAGDGIQASNTIYIEDGNIDIQSGGGYSNVAAHTGSGMGGMGGWGGMWGTTESDSSDDSDSTKGIKSDKYINIAGGTITVDSADDSIHCDVEIVINDGDINISAGDDGIHADSIITINGGDIDITTSYEGIESNLIYINGGDTTVYASDDGLNANNGGSETPLIKITGGNLSVTTPTGDTDGIDSNGNIEITGGYTIVYGGSSSGSMAGSVDLDGQITVTGGTVIALGGICETPSSSGCCNLVVMSGLSFTSGDYTVTDSSGNEVISFTVNGNYSSAWICSENLELNESYTLKAGSTTAYTWTQDSQSVGSSGMGGFGGNMGGFGGNTGGFGGNMGGFGGGGRR